MSESSGEPLRTICVVERFVAHFHRFGTNLRFGAVFCVNERPKDLVIIGLILTLAFTTVHLFLTWFADTGGIVGASLNWWTSCLITMMVFRIIRLHIPVR